MSGGAFAPGLTVESTGLSEIEITTSLGDTSDLLIVRGTPGDDTIRVGQTGVGLNADDDLDVGLLRSRRGWSSSGSVARTS